MRYLIFFLATFLFAQTTIDGITIYNLPQTQKNYINPFEYHTLNIKENENNESNITITFEETFNSNIKSIKPKIDIAVIINKTLFKKYLPSIINSLNAYFLYKNCSFNLTVYDINQTKKALKHKNIIYYTYNPNDVYKFKDYNNTFYFPIINKYEVNFSKPNFFFGGIDYNAQVKKLSYLIETNKTIAINEDTITSKKILNIEKKFFKITSFMDNNINFKTLNNNYVFLNTSPQKSVQILSNIYYQNISPNLILSTQINYSPLLISLTQQEALNKLIIANSIINPPKELADINMLLNSDIKFNWLNYSASILCNKIYNSQSEGDTYLMNDFLIYMFDNQINYKTNLYQIAFKGFKKILFP